MDTKQKADYFSEQTNLKLICVNCYIGTTKNINNFFVVSLLGVYKKYILKNSRRY